MTHKRAETIRSALSITPEILAIFQEKISLEDKRRKLRAHLANLLTAISDNTDPIRPMEWILCRDAVWVFSVGGGSRERGVSANLVHALEHAREVGASILGVVGKPDGFTAQVADACVVVPVENPANLTPHAESFQGVIWHLVVAHPEIIQISNKWESLSTEEKEEC